MSAAIIVFIILLLIGGISIQRYEWNKERESWVDDLPVMDEVQKETYNKYPLFIREVERAQWDALPRGRKRELCAEFDKKIKKGQLIPVVEDGVTRYITRSDAKKYGKI